MMDEEEDRSQDDTEATDRHIGDAQERILPSKPRSIRDDNSFLAFKLGHGVVVFDDSPVVTSAAGDRARHDIISNY